MELELVHCARCAHFAPDTVGSGEGVGSCRVYEAYRDKGASQKNLDAAFVRLGGKLFWRGNDDIDNRYCDRFKAA